MAKRHYKAPKHDEIGFALPAVLFVMALVGVLAVGSLTTSGDERQASHGMREATKALYAAEAGVTTVLSDWATSQYDTLMAAPGDSAVLPVQTLANGCSYQAVLRRVDDGSGAPLFSVRVAGASVGALAGQRSVGVIFRNSAGTSLVPGVLFGGGMELSGQPQITGACGDFHANGDILKGAKNLFTLDGDMTATGIIEQGKYQDSNNDWHTPVPGEPPLTVPQLDPLDYCPSDGDWIVRNNWVIDVGPPADSTAVGSDPWGFDTEFSDGINKYILKSGATPQGGTLCVFGNIELSGGAGADGAPIDMSIVATGSVQLTGTSFINAVHPDGIAILAGGDVELSGSSGTSSDNFQGFIYADSQCDVSGESTIVGNLICADNPNPPGTDIPPFQNELSGSISIDFGCSSALFSGPGGIIVEPGSWINLSY